MILLKSKRTKKAEAGLRGEHSLMWPRVLMELWAKRARNG